jgi:hypothetical protein
MRTIRIKYLEYLIALAGYFVIAIIMLQAIIMSPGTIGFFHDWFIGPYPEMNHYWASNGFYVWDSQLGNKVYGTDWIFRLSIIPLSFLGGEILSKGLIILIVTMSGFGAFCLGKRLKLGPYAAFAAGAFYIFSPVVYTRMVAGHLYYLIAYFLSPLILWSFLKGKENNNLKYFMISALLLSLAAIQLQFIVMITLILLVFTLTDIKKIKKGIVGLFIVVSISLVINLSPVMLPQLLVKNGEIPFSPTQLLSYHGLTKASDLAESFRMLGYANQPYSYLNLGTSADLFESNEGIIPDWIFYLDFVLPAIGFSVLLFRRDRYTLSFAIIAIVGLFLLKGLNVPFPNIFGILFLKGLYIFREIWHLAFLYVFSLTLLMALFLERLVQLNFSRYVRSALCVALALIIVISNGYPLLLGNFAGYLQTYSFPSEYHTIYNEILSNPNYNTLILPYVNPIKYDNLTLEGLDPLITDSSTMIFPTILGSRGSPTLGFSTWLLSSMQENKTNNMGNLLSGIGIKYIVLRKDFVSNYPNYTPLGSIPDFREKWYGQLQPFLDSQRDLKLISNTSNYVIYENLNNVNKLFLTSNSAGGLSDFDSLLLVSNVTSLTNISLLPTISANDSVIFVDNKTEMEMPINDFISIGKYSTSLDPINGWSDNKNSFGYDHILASRVNEGIFSDSSNSVVSFEIPSIDSNTTTEVWMKALSWNQGGKINLQINNEARSLSLFSNGKSFSLFKIFEGKQEIPLNLTLSNIHGKNYIEGIYLRGQPVSHYPTDKYVFNDVKLQNETNLITNSEFSIFDSQRKIPSYWNDPSKRCVSLYICKIDIKDGWDDDHSLKISTSISDQTWTSIYSNDINVKPKEHYELGTHIKLNNWVTGSHVTLDGFNETLKKWYQITQCPSGSEGPMEWIFFTCSVIIPEDTTKARVELKAGWSSDPKEQAISWFDALYLIKLPNGNDPQTTIPITSEKLTNDLKTVEKNNNRIIESRKDSPTHWLADVEISRPTTIGFAEPYDQSWSASVYKEGNKIDVIKAVPMYGTINGFYVKDTGNLEINIEYLPQNWYDIGLIISFLTIAISILYIIIGSKSREIVKWVLRRLKFSG